MELGKQLLITFIIFFADVGSFAGALGINELDSTLVKPRVLLIGPSSFIGYHLSVLLNKKQYVMKLVEDSFVKHVFDQMISERLTNLQESVETSPVQFIDFSDHSKPSAILEDFKPDVIVYIPTALFAYEEAMTANRFFSIADFSRELKFYFNLLTNIDKHDSHFILASSSSAYDPSISKPWFGSHENLLSSLRSLAKVHSSILRLHNVYGELKMRTDHESDSTWWYVEDVIDVFEKIMKSSKSIFTDFGCQQCSLPGFLKLSVSRTAAYSQGQKKWEEYFLPANGKSVVMTTYFTAVKNPMHSVGYATNKFRFIRSWLLSARDLHLDLVVFHDQLSDDFRRRLKAFYPRIEFVKSSSAGQSPNDKRFQIFADYVSSHNEVQNVLLTDLRDVTLGHDPFEIMKHIGDYIFVGQDLPYFFSTSSYGFVLNKVSRCYGTEAHGEAVKLYTLFNAGVLGGSRTAMLKTLELINDYLRKSPSSLNCNMPALAMVLHKHLYEQTFSGYPFNNLFGVEYAGSQGVAVMHKTGHRIYP